MITDLSDYYLRWYHDKPVAITTGRRDELREVHRVLYKCAEHLALHYKEYVPIWMPLGEKELEILEYQEQFPFKAGTWRPDYIIGVDGDLRICEITSRFFAHGIFMSRFAEEAADRFIARFPGSRRESEYPALMDYMASIAKTSTTISLEGKEWWILKSLPVSNKMILDSKLVFNLLLDLPFFVIIQILLAIGNKGDLVEILWSVVLMGAVVTFSCIFSLTMNLKVPKMEWDNEVIVIKQSASAGLSMLGMLPCIFLGMLLMVAPSMWLMLIRIIICVLLGGTAALLYRYNVRFDLRKI